MDKYCRNLGTVLTRILEAFHELPRCVDVAQIEQKSTAFASVQIVKCSRAPVTREQFISSLLVKPQPEPQSFQAIRALPALQAYRADNGTRTALRESVKKKAQKIQNPGLPRSSYRPCRCLTCLYSFSFMRGFLPKYFSSEWSFAQFRVPETRTICTFGTEKNTIIGMSKASAV